MQLSHRFGSSRGILVLGLALAALVALPPTAKADDNNDWDWKSTTDKDHGDRDSKDGGGWVTQDGNGGWVAKDDDGNVRVYAFRRNQDAATGAGYLGVQVQDVTAALKRAKDLRTSDGALVNDVENGSPADDAGIQRGDVIISLNGNKIEDSQDLIAAVRGMDPGDRARVEVERDGSRRTLDVKVGERSRRSGAGLPPGFRGRWQVQGDDSNDNDVPTPPMMQFHRQNMDELRDQLQALEEQLDELNDQLRGLREDLQRLDSNRGRTRSRDDRGD